MCEIAGTPRIVRRRLLRNRVGERCHGAPRRGADRRGRYAAFELRHPPWIHHAVPAHPGAARPRERGPARRGLYRRRATPARTSPRRTAAAWTACGRRSSGCAGPASSRIPSTTSSWRASSSRRTGWPTRSASTTRSSRTSPGATAREAAHLLDERVRTPFVLQPLDVIPDASHRRAGGRHDRRGARHRGRHRLLRPSLQSSPVLRQLPRAGELRPVGKAAAAREDAQVRPHGAEEPVLAEAEGRGGAAGAGRRRSRAPRVSLVQLGGNSHGR